MSEAANNNNNNNSGATVIDLIRSREGGDDEASSSSSPNSKRQRRLLDWRMDPEESRSDFIIEIVLAEEIGKEKPAIQMYRVHKNVLEFGEKASGYFSGLFASQTAEAMNNKARIYLDLKLAASAFPLLLDFMYGLDGGHPNLTMKNAASLYHLADYFEVEILFPEILKFWKERLQLGNLVLGLKQATMFHIVALREIVVEQCCAKIGKIAADSPLVAKPDPTFWVEVLSKTYETNEYDNITMPFHTNKYDNITMPFHPNLPILIAEFCFIHKEKLDKETLRKLTGDKFCTFFLPYDSAIKILEAEKVIVPKCNAKHGLTDLQTRCIVPLASDWKNLKESTHSQNILRDISPVLLSKVMAASLKKTGDESDTLKELLDQNKGPSTITVTGTGYGDVDGVYREATGTLIEYHKEYHKQGVWKGKFATFRLCLLLLGPTKERIWWLLASEYLNTGNNFGFFRANAYKDERMRNYPPRTGWRYFSGYSPAPDALTLSFNYEEEEDIDDDSVFGDFLLFDELDV